MPQDSFRSVHTLNFPSILQQLRISLIVSTYQAGKVILVRSDGDRLNTHFRLFNKPMGLAANRSRIAIGTATEVIELYNMPAVAVKLDPPGKHDACYIPRNLHVTGDIDIHEMAWANEQLWIVNTRFSCLCTLEPEYSFTPRWRPPFITALGFEDRCHLNGLGLVGDRPKYVTALGETNTPQGWRDRKATGGILMDIDENQVICRGLAMPHSPRWYQGKLWALESGNGSLIEIDPATGTWKTVATFPGFTRGLTFYNTLAFVGLSQVRETAVFSGIPLTERLTERTCGVWVVNIQNGEIVAFLRFEEAVQEIFALEVLPDIQFPEILENDAERLAHSYALPDEALGEVNPQKP
ncbi:MAG: TIGR03032 family protein [Jaaginema sp. PMC 1079.18]|nr:TIGR03032 family protein [Jaaginema sp. PMC 1080.18]MEC4853316.1 TIGR03032 family protein [Jaaginema sp. PMC 1079.18]MEC4865828.1 TIGR03032 family protein [Jaaginema sp. PMC 1078.18]